MNRKFGFSDEIFVNQDEGTFVAFPYTFSDSVNGVTLETYQNNGKRYVQAGSVVREGSKALGIVPEEYCISDGPVVGRIVVAGYCYFSKLTPYARDFLPQLSQIVTLPYNQVVVRVSDIRLDNEQKVYLTLKVEGAVWASSVQRSMFDVSLMHTDALESVDRINPLTLTLVFKSDARIVTITSIDKLAFSMPPDLPIKGLPIYEKAVRV